MGISKVFEESWRSFLLVMKNLFKRPGPEFVRYLENP